MSLLVVGSVALDTVRTPDGKEYPDVLGGSCTYFSYAASFLTDVQVVGVVGEDFGTEHTDLLKSRKIDLEGLEKIAGGKTFRWAGTYAENMNDRTTDDLQFGVLGEFDPKIPESYKNTEYVFLACAQPQLQMKVIEQMNSDPFVVFDTIEVYIQNDRADLNKLFKRCHGVIVNDSEVKLLTGDSNMVAAAPKLLEMGPKFAVIKKGEHGGLLACEDGIFPFPAFPLGRVVDPTGAGDSFAAGFMGYIAKTGDTSTTGLRKATAYGTTMASYACEGISLSKLAELDTELIESRKNEFIRITEIPQ